MTRTLIGLALFLLGTAAPAADLNIMPTAVQLDRGHDRATVHVTNNGSEPVLLQADTIAWKRDAGVDRDEASDALIINPGVFTLAPGKTQVVRVGLRRRAEADQESTYRMVLREVPVASAADDARLQGQVRVLVTLRVPVYVAPSAVRRDERWSARFEADGRLVAQVSNQGNVHYRIASLRIQGDEPGATLLAQGPESVLFPGEIRQFRLPPRATNATNALPAAAPAVTLEVMTDRGMQHVAVDPAAR